MCYDSADNVSCKLVIIMLFSSFPALGAGWLFHVAVRLLEHLNEKTATTRRRLRRDDSSKRPTIVKLFSLSSDDGASFF